MPNRDDEFEKWYGDYFCDQQGEDSPYSYNDVKIAFYTGWKRAIKNLHSKDSGGTSYNSCKGASAPLRD